MERQRGKACADQDLYQGNCTYRIRCMERCRTMACACMSFRKESKECRLSSIESLMVDKDGWISYVAANKTLAATTTLYSSTASTTTP